MSEDKNIISRYLSKSESASAITELQRELDDLEAESQRRCEELQAELAAGTIKVLRCSLCVPAANVYCETHAAEWAPWNQTLRDNS